MTIRIGSQPTTQQATAAPTTPTEKPQTSMDAAMSKLDSNISSLSSQYGSAGSAGSDGFAPSPLRSGGGGGIRFDSSAPTAPEAPGTGDRLSMALGESGGGGRIDPSASETSVSQPAQQEAPSAPQSPSMDSAQRALDEAIKSLATSFHKDSYNGQAPPADGAPTTTNGSTDLFNQNPKDMFSNPVLSGGEGVPVAAPVLGNPNDPILDLKGGGGMNGGVVNSSGFLNRVGGGGMNGGVVNY